MRTIVSAVLVTACLSFAIAAGPSLEKASKRLSQERYAEAAEIFEAILEAEPQSGEAWLGLGIAQLGEGDLEGGIIASEKAAEFPQHEAHARYNLACALSLAGRAEEGLESLLAAYRAGFHDRDKVASDEDLEAVRALPDFRLPVGRVTESLELDKGKSLRYKLVLPVDFDAEKSYPLLIALAPGSETLESTDFVLNSFWGEQAAQLGWIVAAPESPRATWRSSKGVETMGRLLDELESRFNIEGKTHLGGCSNGGNSAFHLARNLPERFASLTVVPGSAPPYADVIEPLRQLKILLFVGENDGNWLINATNLREVFDELEIDADTWIIEDEGHVLRPLMGDRLIDQMQVLRSR